MPSRPCEPRTAPPRPRGAPKTFVPALSALIALALGRPAAAEFRFEGTHPIRIAATVGMVADVVERVGGDRVSVEALMGPGVDPHLYKATRSDVQSLDEADAIFYGGLHLEGKMVEILHKIGRAKPSVALAERLPKDRLIDAGEGEGEIATDPHVWFDASLWALTAEVAGDTLAEFDPPGADLYRARAEAYRKEAEALHEWILGRIAEVPEKRRVLITAHDAFEYFGRAYGIEVLGLQGISTASEFGLNDVNRLVDTIVERKVKAVFVESSVPPRNLEAVQEGCRARGHEVGIGGTLFSDAMGEAGTPEGTYFGMVRHNVNAIVDALK